MGIAPGRKALVFFLSLVAITVAMGNAYGTFAVICFVLFALLSARRQDMGITAALAIPIALYVLMIVSLIWTDNLKVSAVALGKEAALLFIPLAFCLTGPLSARNVNSVLKNFSLAMCIFGVYLIIRALLRFYEEGDPSVFFYNELADLNVSIYLASFFSVALFVFLAKEKKTFWGYTATLFLLILVLLLSRRSIIITDILIITGYYVFYPGISGKRRILYISGIVGAGALFIAAGNLSGQAFPFKAFSNHDDSSMTLSQAWSKPKFSEQDGFTGPSFRVYRARVLKEMTQESGFFFKGSGLNASAARVTRIAKQDNLPETGWLNVPYYKLNFHNQFMEAYADLGFFGLALVLLLAAYNLVVAVKNKYFVHIAFAILMIALFLTESFLWRQKGVVFFMLFYCLFNGLQPVMGKQKK